MGEFGIDPPADDQEAKDLLTMAYQNVFGPEDLNLFALGFAQAMGLMEGDYGRWGPGDKSNNWGAITIKPNDDGTCPSNGFKHSDSSSEGEYQTCFRLYDTSLAGAEDFLREIYDKRRDAFQAAVDGDLREFARQLYATSYYLGTAPHNQKDENGDFTNVNRYIDFLGRGIEQIQDLYPHGGEAQASSGVGLYGLAALALVGVAVVAKRRS